MILRSIPFRSLATPRQFVVSIRRSITSSSVVKMAAESGAGPAAAIASLPTTATTYKPRYVDIGINLADPIFRGIYHGTQRHPDDLGAVIARAKEVGCHKLIVTGSDFQSSRDGLKIAQEYPGTVYTTAGIHPCSSAIFGKSHVPEAGDAGHTRPCDPDPSQPQPEDDEPDAERTAAIMADLEALIAEARQGSGGGGDEGEDTSSTTTTTTTTTQRPRKTKKSPLVALGECGLDYDRLHYCSARLQRHGFAAQLALAARLEPPLPLFLHSRAAHADFVAALQDAFGPRLERLRKGAVVHSFTGTAAELRELLALGLHVGVNGCSLKTAENCDVVREDVALDSLMLETDGPWCEIRPSHAGWAYLVEAARATAAASAAAAAAAPPISENTSAVAAEPTSASAFTTAPPGTSTPVSGGDTGTSTPVSTAQKQPRPPKKKQQPAPPKNKKKEPEVPERFPSVKKEKWVEGAMVKSRNEPCTIERVATAVAGIKGVPLEEVCEAAWRNTTAVFDILEEDEV